MKYILDRKYARKLLDWAYEQTQVLGSNIQFMLPMQLKK